MPVRPKLQAVQDKRIPVMAFLLSDGTRGATGDDVFPDRETARREWPSYRRETWARAWRGDVPYAAGVFDGLTTAGFQLAWDHWRLDVFPIAGVLERLEQDRAAVERFRERDPKGARSIADYLQAFEDSLQTVEEEARTRAVKVGPGWQHACPRLRGGRYGDAQKSRLT